MTINDKAAATKQAKRVEAAKVRAGSLHTKTRNAVVSTLCGQLPQGPVVVSAEAVRNRGLQREKA